MRQGLNLRLSDRIFVELGGSSYWLVSNSLITDRQDLDLGHQISHPGLYLLPPFSGSAQHDRETNQVTLSQPWWVFVRMVLSFMLELMTCGNAKRSRPRIKKKVSERERQKVGHVALGRIPKTHDKMLGTLSRRPGSSSYQVCVETDSPPGCSILPWETQRQQGFLCYFSRCCRPVPGRYISLLTSSVVKHMPEEG